MGQDERFGEEPRKALPVSLNSTHSDTTLLRPCDREFKTKIVSYHMRHLKFGQAIYWTPLPLPSDNSPCLTIVEWIYMELVIHITTT